MKYQKGDYLFDGFCHRGYDEDMDGWRNALPDARQYPSVMAAQDVLNMFDELSEARKHIWRLEKELALWKPVALHAITGIDPDSTAQRGSKS